MFHVSPFTSTHAFPPRTILEQTMMKTSALIRSKPNWREKYKNKSIVKKWKTEVSTVLNAEAFDYVVSELEYYDRLLDQDQIEMSTVDGVWQSDTLLNPKLRHALLLQVKKLEQDEFKSYRGPDFHPNSNDQVLDLVHPSLYCRHVTQIKDKILKKHKNTNMDNPNYQWIPSNFESGKFTSTINNLDVTKHQDLYTLLEQIFQDVSIPLINRVIQDWKVDKNSGVKLDYSGHKCYSTFTYPLRINVDAYNWYTEIDPINTDISDEDYEEYYNSRELKPIRIPKFIFKDSLKYHNYERHENFQVIVKIATIMLTRNNPSYAGGVYHIEGTSLENIFASQICYLDSENISQSKLAFRCAVLEPRYKQNDNRGVEGIYGLRDTESLVNNLGSVETFGGRCIAFPNLFQHKVEPFTLLDPSKPGFRRILVFFIINPDTTIPSTANLEPKQIHLYRRRILSHLDILLLNPIWDIIIEYSGNAWTWEEAKEHRIKLMHERKYIQSQINDHYFEREFSLCEH